MGCSPGSPRYGRLAQDARHRHRAAGAVLLDTPLSGVGFGKEGGDCDVGAQALSKAANQAIEAMTKDYIARVVKSGLI